MLFTSTTGFVVCLLLPIMPDHSFCKLPKVGSSNPVKFSLAFLASPTDALLLKDACTLGPARHVLAS